MNPQTWLLSFTLVFTCACVSTNHATVAAGFGRARPSAELEALVDVPGPLTLESVVSADWHVARGGLINLEHPKAKAAHLVDGEEPIQLLFHAIRHPTRGLYIVDSGAERALRDAPDSAAVSGLVARFADVDELHVRTALGDWLSEQREPLRGVFLTHLHLDHVAGLPDVPASVPIYIGPGESSERAFMNLLTRGIVDSALAGKGPLRELRFQPELGGRFEGVLDLFGDGSLWALWVPGHTAGSVAFVARTTNGPVLLTGDACHTVWGWRHAVEPGTFSQDRTRSVGSLQRLQSFATRHPGLDIRLGHQSLSGPQPARSQAPAAPSPLQTDR